MLTVSTLIALLVTCGVLFALLHRVWTALALTTYLMCFVVAVSVIKQAYLGMAASLADVEFFLRHPVGNFRLFVNYPLLGMALLTVLGGFAVCLLVGLKFEPPLHHAMPTRRRWWWRGVSATVSALASVAGVMVTQSLHAKMTEEDVFAAFKSMYQTQTVEGFANRLNYFFDNRSTDALLPSTRRQQRFVDMSPEIVPTAIHPDILMILEESTFDSSLIRGCLSADCDHAMLHPLATAKRAQQGPLQVHSTGGGTWLSEFAFLSGYDWRVFGRGGAFAPVSVAPRLQASLPLRLRQLGYRTIAVIPTDANFLGARAAYQHYGFDEFYAASELHLPNDWQAIRDGMLFDATLKLAKEHKSKQPLFLFVLTLRNHGPHGSDGDVPIKPTLQHLVPTLGDGLADYLGRMRDSSDDYVQLAQRWFKSSRPRVLGWFGDHQPETAWDVTRDPAKRVSDRVAGNVDAAYVDYLTYYQLLANFGEPNAAVSGDALDIAYLGEQLLSFAGVPADASMHATAMVRQQCQGMLLTCADHALVSDYLSFRVHQLHEVR